MDKPQPKIPANPFALIVSTKISGTIIETTLRRNSIPTLRFESGSEAIRALNSRWNTLCPMAFIDLVPPENTMLDQPGMSGYELINHLRTHPSCAMHFQRTVFVALQDEGRVNPVSRARARLAGAVEYLPKPFEARQIVDLVQKYS